MRENPMSWKRWLLLGCFGLLAWAAPAPAVDLPKTDEEKQKLTPREIKVLQRQMRGREDEASAAFKNAETAFLVGEFDKSVEEFMAVAQEYPDTSYRMRAVLRVGDVYYRQKQYERAVSYYQRALKVPSEVWWPEETAEEYARADYMIGVCYFDQNGLDQAFAHFRGFVKRHPESQFVDRAYDFIGRGNMQRKRYGQALEAFQMIGIARLGKDARRTISPGEDLYVRVTDADVGLAQKGAPIFVKVTTTGGDEELVQLDSLGIGSPTFMGMIKTRLGAPRLTFALDSAFTMEQRKRMDEWVETAKAMEEEAATLQKSMEDAAAQAAPAAGEGAKKDGAVGEGDRARLAERVKKARDGAVQLQGQAFKDLDAAFGRVEAVLAQWGVAQPSEEAAAQKEEEKPAEEEKKSSESAVADEGKSAQEQVSDVFTSKQILETRQAIKTQPTTAQNFRFRRALLEYWHGDLLREFKTLDLTGADTVTVEYIDAHGAAEDKVVRKDALTVASDARLMVVGPDLKSIVNTVILGDDVRVKVADPDMDQSGKPDTIQVTVSSAPKVNDAKKEEDKTSSGEGPTNEAAAVAAPEVSLFPEPEKEEVKPAMVPQGAPSFSLTLVETGPHSGEFVGVFPTLPSNPASPVVALQLSPQRLARVAYGDTRTSTRPGDWVLASEVSLVPGAAGQEEVIEMQESSLDHRSELKKGVALGQLARVYQDIGLKREAARTFDEALKVVKKVVDSERNTPLGEEATYQMWDLYFASGDENAAAEACSKLIAAFPNSPLADDALLIMGKAAVKVEPSRAIANFTRLVAGYPDSPLAPEAQYLIADLKAGSAFDVAAFESCANRYPDSNFAAKSLLRLAEYYMETKDYARAREYLERITLDFPDFDMFDKTTYMRGICAYRQGDIQLAYMLMHEVVEKYPGTAVATSAGKIITLLAGKLQK